MAEAVVTCRYLSAGANRYSAAADWGDAGTVAFGSDSNVCFWNPAVSHLPRGERTGDGPEMLTIPDPGHPWNHPHRQRPYRPCQGCQVSAQARRR